MQEDLNPSERYLELIIQGAASRNLERLVFASPSHSSIEMSIVLGSCFAERARQSDMALTRPRVDHPATTQIGCSDLSWPQLLRIDVVRTRS